MKPYSYIRARTIPEAIALLNEAGVVSRPLAGGTDLVLLMRHERKAASGGNGRPGQSFDRVVDISLIPELRRIAQEGQRVIIGAAASFSEVIESDLVWRTAATLAQACQLVGATQIRNMGTLGGNVANAAACADSLPALVCMDAAARLLTAQGERVLPVSELILRPNRTQIPPGGLLLSLEYTIPAEGSRSVFIKLGRRNAMAISRLTVAALGRLDASGRIAEARLAPGSAAPQFTRFTAVEAMLLGQAPGRELFAEAGQATIAEVRRITGVRWSSEYKEPALRSMVAKALRAVFSQPPQGDSRRIYAAGAKLAASPAAADSSSAGRLRLKVNGHEVSAEAAPDATLLSVLRDQLGLTGAKQGCGVGECGACSVLLDGRLVNSCLTLAWQAAGREVVTIEGIHAADGALNDLQQAFIDYGAVQCGYCIPGMVLAGESLLARTLAPSRDEIRSAIAGNLCRCTGYQQIVDAIQATAARRSQASPKAEAAPVMAAAVAVDPAAASTGQQPATTYVGKPARRVDAPEKVTGQARYAGDLHVPGMLLAGALRSDLPHARIAHLDVTPALQVPGVLAAITCEDFVDHGRFGYPVQDMYMLAYRRVRYVGDPIAVVAAENEAALAAGLAAIRLELQPLEAVFDPALALEPGAPLVGQTPPDSAETPRGNLLIRHVVRSPSASPTRTAGEAAARLDERYATLHQEHAYLEPEAALAVPWPDGGGVTLYSSNQSPFITRDNLVKVLGLLPENVRVIQPPVGGAFGGKDDTMYQVAGQVARLALLTRRPVRMVFSREESMIASYKRNPMQVHIQLSANPQPKGPGSLSECKVHLLVDSGAYSAITPFVAWRGTIHAMGPYRYANCTVDTDVVYTNNGYTGAFRGFGNTEVTACIEQAIDQIAEMLAADPIDFRLANCLRPGDLTPHGQPLGDDVALVECLEQVRRDSDWDRKRKEYGPQPREDGLSRGIGVACMFHGLSLGAEGDDFAVSTVTVNPDYSLTLTSGLTDYGTGSRTVYTLIAAETLGLRPERFHMLRPDTDTARNSGPTVASRATVMGGNATRAAAMRLDALLTQAAAEMFGCSLPQVLRHGETYIGPNEEPASFESVVDYALRSGWQLSAQGRWDAPRIHWDAEKGQGKPYFAYHFGAQVAEVAVEAGTGRVEVRAIYAAHNTGKVIFPLGALGQLYGGITQGLGYALIERVDYEQGYLQATNFDEYLIPTALDVPEIVGRFVEKPFKDGPFGAKNLGEPGMVPTAPAILNAIYHATGQRVRQLPASLERVLLGHDLRPQGSGTACKLGLQR
jgi:CO/xanthine dehydrogenase Mo-binding subunit/aerobic-type carbon monoxide dehydrogenase small subunit (CoxS/CutS family)/CO/xanthine dehydrogenase FAD-binding subunit